MRTLICFLVLCVALLAQPTSRILIPASPPGGVGAVCTDHTHAYLTTTGQFVSCVGGVWTATSVGSTLPSQTGHAGEFLDTNGSTASWSPIHVLGTITALAGTGTQMVTADVDGELAKQAIPTVRNSAGSATHVQTSDGSNGFSDSGCTATSSAMTCSGGYTTGPSAGALLSGSEQAAPTTTTPTLFFDDTAHLPQYKNASNVLTGSMVLPKASATSNQWVQYIGTDGVQHTAQLASTNLSDSSGLARTIASGAQALGTSEISANDCATVVTVAATGVVSTDVISFTPNGSIKAVTGYTPAGTLTIVAYPTSGNVNFDVCNKDQSNAVTPSALTLNWRVSR